MDNVIVDRSGTLQDGLFYELSVLPSNDYVSMEHSESPKLDIVSLRDHETGQHGLSGGRDYIAARIDDIDGEDKDFGCPIDNTHQTASYWRNVKVELSSGRDYSDLIYGDMEGNRTVLVSERMSKRLKASSFRGFQLSQVEVDYWRVADQKLSAKNFPLFDLQFRGRACRRGFSVVGAPNACPHCGRTPLICSDCGYYNLDCPKCGKDAWVVKKNHKGAGDVRLISAGWEQWSPMVIDVNRWDGADFIFVTLDAGLQTNVVTKRVVDWLVSIHAAPFVARPVQARLDDATPQQLKWLEEAKGT